MAVTEHIARSSMPARLMAKTRALLLLAGVTQMQRSAGLAFFIRAFSAVLAYLAQVLLARWMGTSEYGVYVYAWTWVLLLGSMMDFGIAVSAQKFIPDYRATGQLALLRGFLAGSRLLTFGVSATIALALAALVHAATPWLDPRAAVPLMLGCLTLPAFVLANNQDGIARSYDWMGLAMAPQFIVRQSFIIGFTAGAVALGLSLDATVAMVASAAAVWLAVAGQMAMLNARLKATVERGPRAYDVRRWLATALPILMVEGFFLLLGYTDILVLQFFRPSEEVGIYYAVMKTLALVSFVHFAISATTAHRFAEFHAAGDRGKLAAYLAQSIKWTFWPSFAFTALLLAFGQPLLSLFGAQFADGYGLMFVAAIGLLARAAVGPIERLLNMLGQQNICALVYALAFAVNLALCLVLVPRFGGYGAAAATSVALVLETALLFVATRRRLGFHALAWGRGGQPSA